MVHMRIRKRFYDTVLDEHLATHRQMAFVSGPRQVGKTTTCRNHAEGYANWDNIDDREQILRGPAKLAERLNLNRLSKTIPVALFDELHKHPRWKQFLKGFFDTYADQVRIVVTGSSRMDMYRRGGDSLMGRYFLYRMHPFSVAETLYQDIPDPKRIVRWPKKVRKQVFTIKSGNIINISSYAGMKRKEGLSAYSAAKAGLIGMTKSAAKELSRYNISVNAVLPGYMLTDMGAASTEKGKEQALKESIIKEYTDPSSTAEFICYLAGTKGVTGQVFNLDSRII